MRQDFIGQPIDTGDFVIMQSPMYRKLCLLFTQQEMIRMRRWCERELIGDVVVRFHSDQSYNDTVTFYFDNRADHMQFHDRYGDQIIHTHDPINE